MYRYYRGQKHLSNHKLRTPLNQKVDPEWGLFSVLLTVAPRHCLQMAQKKAHIHKKAGFPREIAFIYYGLQFNWMLTFLWEIQPLLVLVRHFTGINWQNSSVCIKSLLKNVLSYIQYNMVIDFTLLTSCFFNILPAPNFNVSHSIGHHLLCTSHGWLYILQCDLCARVCVHICGMTLG